jgi:poly-gamma-glutamate capsule biosynthesis protein CapA/YwtB (metallophosphatase superfamily)
MNSTPAERPRRGLAGRPILTATIAAAALVGAGLGGIALADRSADPAPPSWQSAPGSAAAAPAAPPSPGASATSAAPAGTVSMSGTGDIVMAGLPRFDPGNDGKGMFDQVRSLFDADLVMGNLEQALTDDTGVRKCSAGSTSCHAFRAPPAWAGHLKDAGFDLMNTANNHGKDFGTTGYVNTQKALEAAGLSWTGALDRVAVVDVKGVKVAVVGFAPYAGFNNVNDLGHAKEIVAEAATQADVVVVQVHMGGEGAGKTHVKPGVEKLGNESRGDPIKFSHTVVDAGADLVIGHGPHVLRGMEVYRDRLIAYSLGNFMGGGGALSKSPPMGYSGVLKVNVQRDGTFVDGHFASTVIGARGAPVPDQQQRGRAMVEDLSKADFGSSAVTVGDDGKISRPS